MADYDVEAFIQKHNANKNTISNAGKQAADSMRSVGISSISGKTTTSAAQRIQEQFKKNRERRRNERGLGGSPVVKKEPPMSSYERLKNMVSNLFSFSGGKLVGGTKETDPSKLYSRSSFVIPAAVAVTATELPPAAVAEQSPYTSPYMRPQSSNRDQSPTSYRFAGARDPYMERRGSPGLMAPPTMDQPDTPGMPDAINRAIASIGAEETADYTIQSGDTLSEIAAATGTTVKELQELNGIKNANRIVAGEDISIPIRRAEDKEVVTKATSMEELKPIKASYTMVNALPPLVPKNVGFNYQETSQRLVDDLMRDFDLTKVQASAIAGNLAQETGEFKFLQEKKPTVKGSKGGYGFAQWTGPRRKAYESWAEENGLDVNTYEANYGYLKEELENRQKGTIESMGIKTIENLKKMDDIDDATQYVSEYFLRPGIPHMNKRKKYAKEILEMAD